MLLEICAYNIQSCITAQQAGAGRIELCADPSAGGVTPSHGLIEYTLEHISIPVFPMIRPRGGNFIYDEDEMAIMKKDIIRCREMGCPGIATGVQLTGGRIDIANLSRLVEWAGPMQVTCHKVFDRAPNALDALEAIIAAGCSRLLTSGLAPTALEGSDIIRQLVEASKGRINIMAGGGVRSGNIEALIAAAGAHEYHTSAITISNGAYMASKQEIETILQYTAG